jgi:MATE family multidrug resistance protein
MTDKSSLLSADISQENTSIGYMLKLSGPVVISNISFCLMQFVDRFMVSRLGTNELAAVLPAGVAAFLPGSFALGVITSVNTFVSQSLGRGRKPDCSNYCWQAILMGLVYASVSLAIMWPMAPWIFRTLLSQPQEIVPMEVSYFRIMLYAQLTVVLVWSSSQFFIGIHRPVIVMCAALVAQTVNVTANYVLIFGKFGFPALGLVGAAWGTFIGAAAGAGIRMALFLFGNISAEFDSRRTININFRKMIDLVKVGFPAGLGLMVNIALWGLVLIRLVSVFGREAAAATSAVFSCINVSVMPIVGIGTALTAAVGRSIGSGQKSIASKQTRTSLKIGFIYMGFVGLCFFLFRDSIMSFWNKEALVIEAGARILICVAIFQVFDAATIIYSGALRGAGDTLWLAMISGSGAIFILGLGGAIMVRLFPELGPLGPWIAATVNVIAVGLANRWRFKSNQWRKIDLFKRRAVGLPIEVETIID